MSPDSKQQPAAALRRAPPAAQSREDPEASRPRWRSLVDVSGRGGRKSLSAMNTPRSRSPVEAPALRRRSKTPVAFEDGGPAVVPQQEKRRSESTSGQSYGRVKVFAMQGLHQGTLDSHP